MSAAHVDRAANNHEKCPHIPYPSHSAILTQLSLALAARYSVIIIIIIIIIIRCPILPCENHSLQRCSAFVMNASDLLKYKSEPE